VSCRGLPRPEAPNAAILDCASHGATVVARGSSSRSHGHLLLLGPGQPGSGRTLPRMSDGLVCDRSECGPLEPLTYLPMKSLERTSPADRTPHAQSRTLRAQRARLPRAHTCRAFVIRSPEALPLRRRRPYEGAALARERRERRMGRDASHTLQAHAPGARSRHTRGGRVGRAGRARHGGRGSLARHDRRGAGRVSQQGGLTEQAN